MTEKKYIMGTYAAVAIATAALVGYIAEFNHLRDNLSTIYATIVFPICLSLVALCMKPRNTVKILLSIVFGAFVFIISGIVNMRLNFPSDPVAPGLLVLVITAQTVVFSLVVLINVWIKRQVKS